MTAVLSSVHHITLKLTADLSIIQLFFKTLTKQSKNKPVKKLTIY